MSFRYCILIAIAICSLLVLSVQCQTLTSDQQLYVALNLAVNTLISNGKIASLASSYGVDAKSLTCSLRGQETWPDKSSFKTAMSNILSTGSIRFCRSQTLSVYYNLTTGYEYDLGNQIATLFTNQYGSTIAAKWVRLDTSANGFYQTMLSGVNNNLCDAVLGVLPITDSRAASGNFTCSYLNSYDGYLQGPRNSSIDLSQMSNLNQTGLLIAAISGTSFPDLIATYSKAQLVTVQDTATGLKMVQEGSVSVFFSSYDILANSGCGSACKAYKYGEASHMGLYTRLISAYPTSAGSSFNVVFHYLGIFIVIASFLIVF